MKVNFEFLKDFRKRNLLLLILILLTLLFALLSLITFIAEIRFLELKLNLERKKYDNNQVRSLILVERYKILQNHNYLDINNTLNETKLHFLSLEEIKNSNTTTDELSNSIPYKITLSTINGIQYLFNFEPITILKKNKIFRLIELAYFHEYQKNFDMAIQIYNILLDKDNLPNDKQAYAYLHRGYCKALYGQKQKAILDLEEVISLNPGDQNVLVSAITLKKMLSQGIADLKQINNMVLSVNKGIQYFKKIEYQKAINTFDVLEAQNQKSALLLYYKGRAYEELGNLKAASQNYDLLQKVAPKSYLSLKVQERNYIILSFYQKNQKKQIEVKKALEKNTHTKHLLRKIENIIEHVSIDDISIAKGNNDVVLKEIITEVKTQIKKEVKNTAHLTSLNKTVKEMEEVLNPQLSTVTAIPPRVISSPNNDQDLLPETPTSSIKPPSPETPPSHIKPLSPKVSSSEDKKRAAAREAATAEKIAAEKALQKEIAAIKPEDIRRFALVNDSIIKGVIKKISLKSIKILTQQGYKIIKKNDIIFCDDIKGVPCIFK